MTGYSLHELARDYPVMIWKATEKVYDYVNGRHIAESGWKPFRELSPDEMRLWLQGQYEASHALMESLGSALLSKLMKP